MTSLLDIEDLTIRTHARTPVVDNVSLQLTPGHRIGIVGESGAGKTTLALAALGILRPGLVCTAGTVQYGGQDLLTLSSRKLRRLRRAQTAWLGQDPAAALTPTMPVSAQIAEMLPVGSDRDPAIRRLLTAVGLPADPDFTTRLPRQLSGGQQQRLALARTLAATPRLIVVDEPTSRLDTVTRALVAEELTRQHHELGFAMLLISHDLDIVAHLTDEIVVMRDGRIVETGSTRSVLSTPAQPYTRALREAQPDLAAVAANSTIASSSPPDDVQTAPAIRVRQLCAAHGGMTVLDNIDLDAPVGAAVALLGPSGSGKSTLARALAGLHPPTSGQTWAAGRPLAGAVAGRTREQRRYLQLIGQDPTDILHPRRRVAASVARPARLLRNMSHAEAAACAQHQLDLVGITESTARRLPSGLSGGERQRAAIARALAAEPQVLICDEITSALDATVAAEILALLTRLRRERGLTILFITHDLATAAAFADDIVILEHGRVVETGPAYATVTAPTSDTARALVAAAPSLISALNAM